MTTTRCTWTLAFVTCSLLALPALGGEGFQFPNLNPFAAKKKPATAKFGDDSPGATTIPSAGGAIPNAGGTGVKKTPAQPSTWQKFNSGTQAFLAKTKSTLMPWSKSTPPAPPAQFTGTTKIYNGSSSSKKPEAKKSIFGWMFGGDEPQNEPSTVEDFIGQERPPF